MRQVQIDKVTIAERKLAGLCIGCGSEGELIDHIIRAPISIDGFCFNCWEKDRFGFVVSKETLQEAVDEDNANR